MQIHGDVGKKKEVADEEVNDKGQIVVVIGIYCIAGNFRMVQIFVYFV